MLDLLFYLALFLCAYYANKLSRDMETRRGYAETSSTERPTDDEDDSQLTTSEDDDDVLVDDELADDVPADTTPTKTKRRANSVIDSMGINRRRRIPGYVTPVRTRSLPTEEISPDQGYSATPDVSETRRRGRQSRKSEDILATPEASDNHRRGRSSRQPDAVDANVQNLPRDDESPTRLNADPIILPVHKTATCYKMNHAERGRCVIFNHESFESGFDPRIGSTTDALRIEKTFSKLGFEVEIHHNFYHSEIISRITELSEEDHDGRDCICIFVLTHGISNDLIAAKDVAYRSERIWKPFTADRCRSLAGKPKLFFFQACRGDKLDAGVTIRSSGERSETDSSAASYKIPSHADFLLAHSTVQGFLSWRNPEEGTWYVQSLCDVIDEFWETTDLLSMLTITSRKVATEYSSYDDLNPAKHDQKQVPSVTSMLIRDLYFTRKEK